MSEDDGDWWYFEGKKAVPCRVAAAAGERFGGDTQRAKRMGDVPAGGYDPDERLKDLDRDGVWGDLVFPTIGMFDFTPMIAIIVLYIVQSLVVKAIGG